LACNSFYNIQGSTAKTPFFSYLLGARANIQRKTEKLENYRAGNVGTLQEKRVLQ